MNISKNFPSFQEPRTQDRSMYVNAHVHLVFTILKLEHRQEQHMGSPVYFAFLHLRAEGEDYSLLVNVNKWNLLFTLGLNENGNYSCVQSEGIAIYLTVDSIIFCCLLW